MGARIEGTGKKIALILAILEGGKKKAVFREGVSQLGKIEEEGVSSDPLAQPDMEYEFDQRVTWSAAFQRLLAGPRH